jgi:glycosyltransferase involved in cell wall biosynthesis
VQFSVITPSFRPGPWLRLCIASVADQTGVTWEHIVQDAGSDDGTLDWLVSDSRVQAIVEQDAGMYDAINRGLRRASGDFLAYLNCDEQYFKGTLARVAEYFAAHPSVDVLFGDAVLIDAHGRPLSYRRSVLPWRPHVRWVHLNTLTCSTFFRHSVVERGFFFDPKWKAIGDAVWVDRLLEANVPMAVLPKPLAAFSFTGNNLGATGRARSEEREWQADAWQSKISPLYSVINRFQKWRAGAYRQRDVSMEIYTPDSPDRRQKIAAQRVGYRWPESQ